MRSEKSILPGHARVGVLGIVIIVMAVELLAISLLYQHGFDFTCRDMAPVWFCAFAGRIVPRALGVLAALVLFAIRAPDLDSEAGFRPLSRETFLLLNNVLLVVAAALVFLGTMAPLISDVLDAGKISVGAPWFAIAFSVPMIPLLFLIGVLGRIALVVLVGFFLFGPQLIGHIEGGDDIADRCRKAPLVLKAFRQFVQRVAGLFLDPRTP